MFERTLPVIAISKELRSRLDRQVRRMKQDPERATLARLVRQLLLDGLNKLEEAQE